MKKVFSSFLALALTFGLAACGGSASDSSSVTSSNGADETSATGSTSGRAKTVTLGINTQVSTLDPYNGASTGTIYLTEAMDDSLFLAPALGEPIAPVIGKSYEVSDDNLTCTVEIYDYVHDQAGNKIDANDVAFSYQTYLDTGNATQFSKYLDSVEAIDDTHVVFHLKEERCKETNAVSSILTGCVIYDSDTYNADTFATAPVGCGPYKVTEFVTGASVTLDAYDDNWQTDESLRPTLKTQNVDRVIFKIILEDAQLALALETGDVDAVNYVSADNLQFFMNDDGTPLDGYNIEPFPSILCVNISFNMNPDGGSNVADDINLRLAVEWAIDKESMVQTIMGKTAEVSYGFATTLYGDYNPDWENEDNGYDVETAEDYLSKSNYAANGSPTLRILTESNEVKTKAAQMIQNYLQAIGINSEIITADTALFDNYKYDFSQWDIKIDNNGNRNSLAAMWSNFLAAGHTTYNGVPVSFLGQPDGELSQLATAANNVDTNSQEAVDAVFDCYTKNAIIYGLWGPINYIASQDGITDYAVQALAYAQPWAFTYASDYVGVADNQ